MANHRLDTDTQVFFYENDFYVLSNFSAFQMRWTDNRLFPTSEHLYQWLKFDWKKSDWEKLEDEWILTQEVRRKVAFAKNAIEFAASAHEALKIAEEHHIFWRPDWFDVRLTVMKSVLREKIRQHEYVRRKLLATGNRELIEDSWRDAFWGWGSIKEGKNMLGKLWMEVREELDGSVYE